MRSSNQAPTVNAGSMADIAFLLLIFFLVTTVIPNDKGIVSQLPKPCLAPPCDVDLNERNVLRIALNGQGDLMVEDHPASLKDLKSILKSFIDNNGDKSCNYCHGNGKVDSSDNPQIAVISLTTNRESIYKDFIAIQVELTAAYYELREAYVKENFQKAVSQLSPQELKQVRDAYPLLISEADLK